MAPAGVVRIQIRGPALLGPIAQIRGPHLAVAGTGEVTPAFTAAVGQNAGAVSILMAADIFEIQDLAARWPLFSEPGWLVGTQTDLAQLNQAFDDAAAEADSELRILIARDLALATALGRKWATL